MDRTLIKAINIISISLGLAIIFNFLFFDKLIGLSVLIFALVFLGTVSWLGLREQNGVKKVWWIMVLIVFFALMPSIRANEFLSFLNICAILGLLMLLAQELVGVSAFMMRLYDYFILVVFVPLRMLGQALGTATQIVQIHSNVKHRDVWLRALKGAVMATPILIIFGVLFSQADLAFSQFMKSFINISISEHTIQYFVLLFVAFVASLSFLSYIFSPKPIQSESSLKQVNIAVQSGREIETMVFLGLISGLFLLFIGFQITYLFGGETNIINAGFTYAEYARKGFWELLAVSVLSLLVLLASEKYAGGESKKGGRFLIPALIMIAEIGVVIVSAFKRLSLYVDAYGMTLQRFYAEGFILLLAVLFILLAVKFIKSKPERFFTFGTLLSITSFIIVVNLVNPDVYIIKTNMRQLTETGKVDVAYLNELSADAVPLEIQLYSKLEGEEKQTLKELLQKQKDRLQKNSSNWQSINLSRSHALRLLQGLEK